MSARSTAATPTTDEILEIDGPAPQTDLAVRRPARRLLRARPVRPRAPLDRGLPRRRRGGRRRPATPSRSPSPPRPPAPTPRSAPSASSSPSPAARWTWSAARRRSPASAMRPAPAREFDVVRAQGLVAQVALAIPPLEGQRRAALFQLTALLGRTPAARARRGRGLRRRRRAWPPLIPVGDGAALLKRRPDVRLGRAAPGRRHRPDRRRHRRPLSAHHPHRLLRRRRSDAPATWSPNAGPDLGRRPDHRLDLPQPGRAARPHPPGQGRRGRRPGRLRFGGAAGPEGDRDRRWRPTAPNSTAARTLARRAGQGAAGLRHRPRPVPGRLA